MEIWEGIVITAGLGWVAWISIFAIQINEKANKSLANDDAAQKELSDITKHWDSFQKEFDELKTSMQKEFDKTNNRLDIFLKNELDALKGLIQK